MNFVVEDVVQFPCLELNEMSLQHWDKLQILIENDLSTSVPTLIAHIKSIEGYTTTYRKAWLEKQNVVEDVYDNWERSYHDLLRLLQVMQKFLPGMVVEKETLLMPPQGGQPRGIQTSSADKSYYAEDIKCCKSSLLLQLGPTIYR
ncbi:hypothetical protein JHK82_022697 [Glycine max]|nr:hypothetical protein JHK82_022697 [Glycine max]